MPPTGLLVRSVLLTMPVVCLYLSQYFLDLPGTTYTGFIQFDMPTYVANARQYLESPGSLFYSNPYDWDPRSPRVYFQPLIWLLGLLLRLGAEPAMAMAAVGLVVTISAMTVLQVLLRAYQRLTSPLADWVLVLAAWGGGLFTVAFLVTGRDLDPGYGFWFLNFGRNFIYPTEAFYHLISLLIFWTVLQRRYWLSAGLGFFMAASHPFTGLQYAAALGAWGVLERLVERRSISIMQVLSLGLPLIAVVAYYLVFLPTFPGHAALMERWKFDWSMDSLTIVAAYGPVAALAAHRLATSLSTIGSFERFLIAIALISFGLAKHDVFMDPLQPLHFTRGHIWFPLFLLGMPSLVQLARHLAHRYRRRVFVRLIVLLTFLALFDNIAFIANRSTTETGLFVENSDLDLVRYMTDRGDSPVVFTRDPMSSYLLPVYTSARPFVAHWGNTPYFIAKLEMAAAVFDEGVLPPGLQSECIVIALPRGADEPPLDPANWTKNHSDGWTLLERAGAGCR